ncbi:MAG TPA: polysaccharide deacetylase family protein [Armatimonadota bacterium]|nr:polysaccharide deacetylase family protein [Armatimonadota bacterium]
MITRSPFDAALLRVPSGRTSAPPPGGQDAPAWRRVARTLLQTGVRHSPLASHLLWRLPEGAAGVALTFDDGPDPQHTPRILDILQEAGAKATFFLVGRAVIRCPDLVRRIVAEGHAVGNHTFSHVPLRRLGTSALAEELAKTDRILAELGVPSLPPVRPPWGSISPGQVLHLARANRRIILWSADARDYRAASDEAVAGWGGRLQPRDILLLHDRFPATVAALPRLLRALRERGLTAVSLEGAKRHCPGRAGEGA